MIFIQFIFYSKYWIIKIHSLNLRLLHWLNVNAIQTEYQFYLVRFSVHLNHGSGIKKSHLANFKILLRPKNLCKLGDGNGCLKKNWSLKA